MILTIEELKDLVTGAVELEMRDGMFRFCRFSADQAEKYLTVKNNEDFFNKTAATAGVRLECVTDATAVSFDFYARRCSSRKFCAFDVYLDDVLVRHVGADNLESGEWSGHFHTELPQGEHKFSLYFPNLFGMQISAPELENATKVEAVDYRYKMLCFGDSITQGYDSVYPSLSYVNRMATVLGASVVDKGIGGDRFFPALTEVDDGYTPDLVTVAYGTNDWCGSPREEFETNLRGFMKGLSLRYADAKVFIVTPIWRGNWEDPTKKAGSFLQVAAEIRAEAEKYGFTVIDGMKLMPHDPTFFMPDVLHPNDIGMLWYGEQLAREIQKSL